MTWSPEAEELLINQEYDQLVDFYENLIAENPEEISNYWYLGLAYLFQGKEEEAQSVWMLPFLETGLDINEEELQAQFLEVLEKEATKQEELKNFQNILLIREKIRENSPQNLENLIKLLLLKYHLNNFYIDLIEEFNLRQIIETKKLSEPEINLIISLSEIILEIPNPLTLNFVKIIYPLLKDHKKFTDLLTAKISLMVGQKRFYFYGAKLLEIVIDSQKNNLQIIRQIFVYYFLNRNYEEAKLIAIGYKQHSKNLIEKVFASYQLLLNAISSSDWLNVEDYYLSYQENLLSLQKNPPEVVEKYLATWLTTIGQLLLYLEDKPQQNRLLINSIGRLSQIQSHYYYSCPVNFPLSPKSSVSRKLKIGYIGSTLRTHSVGLLSRWLLHHHNRNEFSIYTYFVCQSEDHITQKFFRDNVDQAYSGNNVINNFLTQIEKDQIDILVDLDSFTHNITGLIMTLKPAPIQVSWLGLDASGNPAIDYFIADPYVLPDNGQDYYSEKIWRLPHTYLGIDGIEVGVTTIRNEDFDIPENAVIYLGLQTGLRRHPENIRSQMRILKQVPNSYFLVSGETSVTMKKNIQQLINRIAKEEDIDPDRIKILPYMPLNTYRANLSIGDVLLDTYPFNGATTTLDALWLNIPLVTRVGQQFHARQGYTFLTNLGITEGIAWTDEEYIEWGIKLGTDENLRKEISWKLRQSKKTSPLWNGKQFTREMEKAYQQMWEIYVNS
jgi:predicted O-linked N-acetylglucosamine transferase (SPINDLY family)